MKKVSLLLAVLLVALIGLFLYHIQEPKKTHPTVTLTPSATTTLQSTTYCLPQDLKAAVMLSHGAGNVYGTLTMTNISGKTCTITGDRLITPVYDTSTIKNITIKQTGTPQASLFTLKPQQILYSQIHYPNGPQCNGPAQPVKVRFTYAISPQNNITFLDTQGQEEQSVLACTLQSNLTTIDVWNISDHPITP